MVEPNKLKRVSYVLLIIILVVVLGFGVWFVVAVTNIRSKEVVSGPRENIAIDKFENAFLVPKKPEENKFYSGKIEYAPEVVNVPLIKHKLVDKEGSTLFYIFSSTNDLNLSVGLDVEIDGKLNKNKYNDIPVLEVSAIKLK